MRVLIVTSVLALATVLPALAQTAKPEPSIVCFALTTDPKGNAVSRRVVAPPAFKIPDELISGIKGDDGFLLTYRASTPGAATAKGPRVYVLLSTSPPLDAPAVTYLPIDATVVVIQGSSSFSSVPAAYPQSELKLTLLPKSSTKGTSASQRAKPEILEIEHADGRKTQLNCGPTPNNP